MSRLFGGFLLILGCITPVLGQICDFQREILIISELSEVLDMIRRELMTTAPSMDVLLSRHAGQNREEIRVFFSQIRLDRLETVTFSQQWTRAAETLLSDDESRRILAQLGSVLGQCSLEEQCQSLQHAAEELKTIANVKKQTLLERKRLWLTISASAGAMLTILML